MDQTLAMGIRGGGYWGRKKKAESDSGEKCRNACGVKSIPPTILREKNERQRPQGRDERVLGQKEPEKIHKPSSIR